MRDEVAKRARNARDTREMAVVRITCLSAVLVDGHKTRNKRAEKRTMTNAKGKRWGPTIEFELWKNTLARKRKRERKRERET